MAAIIGYGVYYGVKKYQKRRDNKKQAAEMQLQNNNNSSSVADPSFEILARQPISSKRPLAVSSCPSYYSESVYSQASHTLTQDRHNSPTFTQFLNNQQASSHPPSYEDSVSSNSSPRAPTAAAAAHYYSSNSSDSSSDEDDDDSSSLLPTPLHLYHSSSDSPPTIMPQRSPHRSTRTTSNIQSQIAEHDAPTPVSATSPRSSSGYSYSYRAELADTSPVSPTAPDGALGTALKRAPRRSSLRRYEVL